MTRQRFAEAERLFHQALELPKAERETFITTACGADIDLASMVQRLLRVHEAADEFLEPPAAAIEASRDRTDQVFGQFRLTRLIGEGGMGAVYEARQERPDRRVALKILRSPLATPGQVSRFDFESQILARLKHPGIAQVYEAGMHRDATGTTPWFAMELIEAAEPVTRWAARCKGSAGWTKETLRLVVSRFIDVCEAILHGHQQGIIHRDLKPANILIDASDRVRVIDFGIARMIESDEAPTRALTSSITGTLAYMAPEVFSHGVEAPAVPDTRGDIYSLGVVLYELLAGSVPLDVGMLPLFEATDKIAHESPPRPGSIDGFLSGDLDAVILKSLAKEPAQRYQSLADFAKDLRRYLAGEAVDARPPTLRYQLRVLARRHRTLVSAGGLIALMLLVSTGVSLRFAMIANQRATEAREATLRAERAAEFLRSTLAAANPMLPAVLPELSEASHYAPFGDWRESRWPFAGQPGRAASVGDLLVAASRHLEREFSDDPLTQAALADALGWTLFRLDRLGDAMPLLMRAAELRRTVLGDLHLETIASLLHLAECLQNTSGRHAEAMPLYKDALSACEQLFGAMDYRTLAVLRQYAQYASAHLHLTQEAEALLAAACEVPSDQLPSVAQLETMACRASLLEQLGRLEEGAALARKTIDLLNTSAYARSANAYDIYGWCAAALGQDPKQLEQVADWQRRAIELRVQHFGEGGYWHAIMQSQLASTLTSLGRLKEAQAAYERSEQLFVNMYGEEHFEPLRARGQLGWLLRQVPGGAVEAQRKFESAADGMHRLFGRLEGYGVSYAVEAARLAWDAGACERSVAILGRAADWACIEPSQTIDANACVILFGQLASQLETLGDPAAAARELRRGQWVLDQGSALPDSPRPLEEAARGIEIRLHSPRA
ncbi:MAG: serine/threonine-protein kinase, partial [Planctomycetota bacterium]|nr:serine/threonine-protein kinase [Planctomycetota bacterium]